MEKNNSCDKKWVCLQITHRYNKTQHVKTVTDFLKTMFKKQQILFLGSELDDQNFNNVMGGYMFLQCDDITPYIQRLKQSKYINNILITFDKITYIDDKQVRQMVQKYQQQYNQRLNNFKFGDIVKIKKGIFKNLYAIVIDIKNQHQVIALFKFISGYRIEKMDVDNCEKQKNLFQFMRVSL